MDKAEVVNVVVKAELGSELNLDFVKLGLGEEAEYRPNNFPGIIYRPGGSETILVFKTGRLVCTGASSTVRARELIQDFVQTLIKMGVEIPQSADTESVSAKELDEKVMEILGIPENIYTNYCVYSDSWSMPSGHTAGFVRRWIDRGQIKLELESLTTNDVKNIHGAIQILTDQKALRILRTITDDLMSVHQIAANTKIDEKLVEETLEKLRQGRLAWRWTSMKDEEEEELYVATGGKVTLHLLSMLQKLVFEPSKWSVIGKEEFYM